MGLFMSLAYLVASIADSVSTNKKIKDAEEIDYQNRIETTNNIINRFINDLNKDSKKIYETIQTIHNSNNRAEYEWNIINDKSVVFDYNVAVCKIAFWLEYKQELFPINWDLKYIWQTIVEAYASGLIDWNIIYNSSMERYFLSITYNDPEDEDEVTVITSVIYNHYDKNLLISVWNAIESIANNTNDFEDYYDIDELEGDDLNQVYEELTNRVLTNINEIDETKYFINKFNYNGYFKYYEFDDQTTVFDDDFALETFKKQDLKLIKENEKDFYKLLLQFDDVKNLDEYGDLIAEKIFLVNEDDDYEFTENDYELMELYQHYFPIFYSYKEQKELLPNDTKLMFALFRCMTWLDRESTNRYSQYKILYLDNLKTYCLFLIFENDDDNVYYDFVTTHINKNSLEDIAILVAKYLKDKNVLDADDIQEFSNKSVNKIKNKKSDFYFHKFGYNFSKTLDDNFDDE